MLPIKMAVVGDSFVALATEVMEVPWRSDFSFCLDFCAFLAELIVRSFHYV